MPAARVPDHRSASAACPNPAVYAAGIVRTRNGCRGCSCRGSNDGTRQFVRAVRAVEGDVTLRLERSQARLIGLANRSEEHTSELQSLMRSSYAVFCLETRTASHA